jgi:hypothetical protein
MNTEDSDLILQKYADMLALFEFCNKHLFGLQIDVVHCLCLKLPRHALAKRKKGVVYIRDGTIPDKSSVAYPISVILKKPISRRLVWGSGWIEKGGEGAAFVGAFCPGDGIS